MTVADQLNDALAALEFVTKDRDQERTRRQEVKYELALANKTIDRLERIVAAQEKLLKLGEEEDSNE
jgi:hypothetical protein